MESQSHARRSVWQCATFKHRSHIQKPDNLCQQTAKMRR